jgi:hypothetical protein
MADKTPTETILAELRALTKRVEEIAAALSVPKSK